MSELTTAAREYALASARHALYEFSKFGIEQSTEELMDRLERLREVVITEIGFNRAMDRDMIDGAVLMAVHLYPQLEGQSPAAEVKP